MSEGVQLDSETVRFQNYFNRWNDFRKIQAESMHQASKSHI